MNLKANKIMLEKEAELKSVKKEIRKRKKRIKKTQIIEKLLDILYTFGSKGEGIRELLYQNLYILEKVPESTYKARNEGTTYSISREGEVVFSCKKRVFEDIDVKLYIPGEWENQVSNLHEKAIVKIDGLDIEEIQTEINELKKKWKL